jgi:hypothetical protein
MVPVRVGPLGSSREALMPEGVPGFLRIRAVKTFLSGNVEIANDLPHLHQVKYEVVAMQPGNPSSSTLGSFSVALHPPGSEGFAAAKTWYDQLDYVTRLEFYISHDGASLGKLVYAGVITGIDKDYGVDSSRFEVSGVSDLFWANFSRPFPGEVVLQDSGVGSTSDRQIFRTFLGTNEPQWTDAFNPYSSGNYTSTSIPGGAAGTFTGTTDDGLNVVSCSNGTSPILVATTGGASPTTDAAAHEYVEVAARLTPSSDTANAGGVMVGLSKSSANATNSIIAVARTKKNGTRWDCDVLIFQYIAGALTTFTASNALTGVDDPDGFAHLTVGLHVVVGATVDFTPSLYANVTVNGKSAFGNGQVLTSSAHTNISPVRFPLIGINTPATGTGTVYLTNLVHLTRYVQDNIVTPQASAFTAGSTSAPVASLPFASDPNPTFLEMWSRTATRENFYWRYTPQAYVVGTRTIGSVDWKTDPGTDRTKSVTFSRQDGNLVRLTMSANADPLAATTYASGPSSTDGNGVGVWRDTGTLGKYGPIEDQTLNVLTANFPELRRWARLISSHKINIGTSGSKTAVVNRDPATADTWRELDQVTIHDPEMGFNYTTARIIGYTFEEGSGTQTITLDQPPADSPHLLRRLQQGIFGIANKFGNRS